MNIVLISRDKRTHDLFRLSWVITCKIAGHDVQPLFRKGKSFCFFIYHLLKAKIYRHKIFVFGISEALAFFLAKPNLIVITGLGRLLMPKQKLRKLFFGLLQLIYKKKAVVVLNKSDYRIFRAIGFNKCYLINGEGVDIKHIQENSANVSYQIDKKTTNFLYVGRLLRSKNVHIVVSYFNTFLKNNKEAKLTLVGDNDFHSSDAIDQQLLDTVIAKYPNNFQLLGYQEDVRPYMRSSDVYISLSEREGLPFSVVEALALGCECILSDVPGHKEFRNIDKVTLVKSFKDFDFAVRSKFKKPKVKNEPDLEKFSQNTICKNIRHIIDRVVD